MFQSEMTTCRSVRSMEECLLADWALPLTRLPPFRGGCAAEVQKVALYLGMGFAGVGFLGYFTHLGLGFMLTLIGIER
jgi:hypothetical protein